MTDSRTLGLAAWRDRAVADDPTSAANRTSKAEVRAYVEQTADEIEAAESRIEDLEATQASGRIGRATWTALSALTPDANTLGEVPPSDTGSHTDPVVGGSVPNSGVFRYSTSPAGWERIAPYSSYEPVDVWLEYVAAPDWETPNKYFVRPVQNIALTGFLTQYRFHLQAPFDNVAGAYIWHMVRYGVTPEPDGTIVAGESVTGGSGVTTGDGGAITIFGPDGATAPPVGSIKQHRRVDVQRNPNPVGSNPGSANAWRLQATSDTVTRPLAEAVLSAELKTPKPLRPVSSIQRGANLCQIGVRMHEDQYDDFTLANQADHLRIGYMDVAAVMGLGAEAPDGLMAMNSMWAEVRNQSVEIANFVFTALDSGTTVETGLIWSAFEAAFVTGDYADVADTSKFGLRGRAHGPVFEVARFRKGYRQDSSVGIPTAATQGAALTITLNTILTASAGQRLRPTGVVGMTEINDVWLTITNVAYVGNTTVLTFAGTDSTGYGAFVSCADFAEHEITLPTPAEINTEWNGIRIVEAAEFWLKTPDGDKWGLVTDTMTFGSEATYLWRYAWNVDLAHADILIEPATRTGGYLGMGPGTGVNRCRAWVAGVAGDIKVLGARDGSQVLLGNAEIVKFWNADFPDIKVVYENEAGVGFTHFADSGSGPVGVAYTTNQAFVLDQDYGPKLYWPGYPNTTPISLGAVNSLSGAILCRLERSPAEV